MQDACHYMTRICRYLASFRLFHACPKKGDGTVSSPSTPYVVVVQPKYHPRTLGARRRADVPGVVGFRGDAAAHDM